MTSKKDLTDLIRSCSDPYPLFDDLSDSKFSAAYIDAQQDRWTTICLILLFTTLQAAYHTLH